MTEERDVALVVDDDPEMLDVLQAALSDCSFAVETCTSTREAIARLQAGDVGVVLTDLVFPGEPDGLELMREIRERWPEIATILMTGHSTIDSAVRSLRLGAFDYIFKPFDPYDVAQSVERAFAYRSLREENRRLRNCINDGQVNAEMVVGTSEAMRRVMGVIRAVAPMPTSVLIRGESGTGKEVVADRIHQLSPRAQKPMIKVNCAALPETLLEDELFGHEKGAFTSAGVRRIGRFEEAEGGTIFLDEIAEMSPLLQAKLLRVLQEKTFQRLGSNQTLHADVRVLCATNRDLESAVAAGAFREDLYYRINVVQITLPPLRDRPEDIPALAEALTRRLSYQLGVTPRTLTPEALEKLRQMPLPGNVRELRNLLERALIFTRRPEIRAEDLSHDPAWLPEVDETAPEPEALQQQPALPSMGNLTLDDVERETIRQALQSTGGNMLRTAQMLGISRSTLYSKVRRHGLAVPNGQSVTS